MENDRFFSLIKLKGISQTHLCSLVGRTRHYLQDVKAGKSTPPDTYVRIWANALDTTYEYLMGMDHLLFENDKERLRYNMEHPDEAHEVFTQRVQHIEEMNRKEKFNELYQQIAKKETAEADFAELERFMEYLVKRGE